MPVSFARSTRRLMVALAMLALALPVMAIAQARRVGPAALRADIAQLRDLLMTVEKSWVDGTRAIAMARLDSLQRAADTISAAGFELAVARIVATADNGHTSVPATRRSNRFNRVGIRLTPFGDEFVVLRTRTEATELLGARLVAIDGRPVAEVRAIGRMLSGGTPAWRDRFVPFLLESPEQLHALGITTSPDAATYRFAAQDGRTIERRLAGEPADSARARVGSQRWLFGDAIATDPTAWQPLRTPAQLPWALQEPTAVFRLREAPEIGAVVVEMRANTNLPNAPIGRFLDSAQRMIERVKPRHVVLDMRLNGGGDLTTSRNFMKGLPGLVPGRVFVLTSPYTFSAGISSVGYVKQAAPERVMIVGEEVGDRLEMWSEGGPTELRNTKILVGTATERHDYVNGCRAYRDCHGNIVRQPISVPTLAPEFAAPWTIEAYLAGRDPAMEVVAGRVARERER